MLETLVVLTIGVALLFDFINGFHDSANAIATVVATRVLKPFQAVLMAGVFNFVGPFVFSLAVANTVGKGIIQPGIVTTAVILGALVGAIVWDLLTWWLALPTSSSHALTGGLVGAALAADGLGGVLLPTRPEALEIARFALYGAAGGLLVGVFMLGWSWLRLPRWLLPAFVLLGAAGLGYFSYLHPPSPYPALGLLQANPGIYVRSMLRILLVNFVFALAGALAGGIVWAGSQQRMRLKSVPHFLLPGVCGTLGFAVLLKTLTLGGLTKTILFMFVSPVLGFYAGFLVMATLGWMWRSAHNSNVDRASRRLQLGSSAFYALTHGTNDAQKTMGVIGVLLFSVGAIGLNSDKSLALPTWVIVASATAMGLGTAFGGWRIVKTMAARITHLTPAQGFAAETGGGVVLVAMAEAGIPVSTTHAISSSIMGVGSSRNARAVRWSVGRQMFVAWIVTIPASALVSWVAYFVIKACLILAGRAG